MVSRRCRRLLSDEDEALDACQDVFVRLIEHRERLVGTYPSSLLYRIATNVCLNRIRDCARAPVSRDEQLLASIANAGANMEGRFFVRNSARELIVELYKPRAAKMSSGWSPTHTTCAWTNSARHASRKQWWLTVQPWSSMRVSSVRFTEATKARGAADISKFDVVGRNRFELRFGMWRVSDTSPSVTAGSDTMNVFAGLQYHTLSR